MDIILRLRAVHWNATCKHFLVSNVVEYFSTAERMQVTDYCALSYQYMSFIQDRQYVHYELPKLEADLILIDFAHKMPVDNLEKLVMIPLEPF